MEEKEVSQIVEAAVDAVVAPEGSPSEETLAEMAVPSPEGSLPPGLPAAISSAIDLVQTQGVDEHIEAFPPGLPPHLEEPQQAMKVFRQLMEIFTSVLERYDGGKKQIVRAWLNATLSPLNETPLHFSYPEEKEIFDLFTELNSAKLILMVHGLADAGVLTLHKPLMESVPKTASEAELNKIVGDMEKKAEEALELQNATKREE